MARNNHQGRRPRGRPRSESTRAAILRSAGELLLDRGLDSISMDAIAERAGASKATIYRWWPSKELLVLDVLFSEWSTPREVAPDTGSLRGDLAALLKPWARELTARPYGRVIAGLVSRARNDPDFADQYRARFVEPQREAGREIFARAIERGEIDDATDIEVALDLLYAPFFHRIVQGHAQITPAFTRAVVDHVVAALRPARRTPARTGGARGRR